MTDIDLHFGMRLRRRRRLLGMSQQELGRACGVRFQQIQKYESGANRLMAARLWDLAEALGVSPGYFFDGLPSRAPRPPERHVGIAAPPDAHPLVYAAE